MPTQDTPGADGCWLGGLPTLPAEIDWPWLEQDGLKVVPMHFMAQIDLSKLPDDPGFAPVPKTGALFFFHANVAHHVLPHPQNHARVIHVDTDVSGCAPRAMPPMPDFATMDDPDSWAHYNESTRQGLLDRWNVDFLPFNDINLRDNANGHFWKDAMQTVCDTLDNLRETSFERTRAVSPNPDAHPHDTSLHQMFGCQTSGNAGSEFLLLSLETDDMLGFTDDYIQSIQFYFESQDARDAFDLTRISTKTDSS